MKEIIVTLTRQVLHEPWSEEDVLFRVSVGTKIAGSLGDTTLTELEGGGDRSDVQGNEGIGVVSKLIQSNDEEGAIWEGLMI